VDQDVASSWETFKVNYLSKLFLDEESEKWVDNTYLVPIRDWFSIRYFGYLDKTTMNRRIASIFRPSLVFSKAPFPVLKCWGNNCTWSSIFSTL
jgi:hypothetical protein